jgi:alkylation response protein AidB-like acyl-CoA dehydrogenase
MDGILAGDTIGIPPVLNFGSKELQDRILPDVYAGKKFICLAISEAFAGENLKVVCLIEH